MAHNFFTTRNNDSKSQNHSFQGDYKAKNLPDDKNQKGFFYLKC